jgi:hypothetical protein
LTCIQEKRVREAIDIASSLQKALSRLQKEMSIEIVRKKELLELAELDNVSKKQIDLEKKELKSLQGVYPDQLYRQLVRWVKAQEKRLRDEEKAAGRVHGKRKRK